MLVRAWDYRQRHHARGVWYRLRRLLADADSAFVISVQDAERLRAEGYRDELVGQQLAPAKVIVRAPADRVRLLASAREVPVSLTDSVLLAECLALSPFDPGPGA
jgi:hypothetical protein